MDREQEELQFLGFFGVCSESIKIISSWRKIFLKITLTLVLPLSLVFLFNIGFSKLLEGKIIDNQNTLDNTRQGTATYNKISNALSSEWTEFLLIKVVYLIFLLIFSLLSTSAIVYIVACVYSGKEISYKRVMSIVPKVWKRLIVTFLCNFVILVVYNIFASLVLAIVLFPLPMDDDKNTLANVIVSIFFIFYLIGFIYISVIWQLASVVSVLEEKYGFEAMGMSKALIKGKMGISVVMFVVVNFCLGWIQFMFEKYVIDGKSIGIVGKVGFGGLSLVAVSILFLFGLVAQTVIYFVCKSYHHENIDKSALSDHLEVYIGDYVPLKAKDIQMEQI